MPSFDYARLRRFPDVEAPNLQAWDATDELLVARALAAGVPGEEIAVIGDEYGAITLALTEAGLAGVRVHQDLVTGRQALALNAREWGIDGFVPGELGPELLTGARLVLLQLPRALAELEEIADAIARWAPTDVELVAGGRVKHMTLAQNEVLGRAFARVQPQRAERKSRLIVAAQPLPVPETPPFPVSRTHDGLVLCAFGGAFAGAALDIGTRVLLEQLPALAVAYSDTGTDGRGSQLRKIQPESPGETPDRGSQPDSCGVVNAAAPTSAPTVVDLGCGTGALAAAFALQNPAATVIATDRSASAVRSARATMTANGLDGRVRVTLDDAGSALPAGSADIVLLNPPFHLGASVHEGAGRRLIDAAARLLRPGGEVWTVFNSHLDHRRALTRAVGVTEQVVRTPKFTLTRSIRRG